MYVFIMTTAQNPVGQIQENLQHSVQEVTVSKGIRNYRALIFQGYIVTVVISFTVIAVFAHFVPYWPIDLAVTQRIQKFNPPWFDFLMTFISAIGMPPQIVILIMCLAGFLAVSGLRWEAFVGVFAASISSVLNTVLKIAVNRDRPSMDLVNVFSELKDYSFPSGHVMLYTTFFGYLLFLTYTLISRSHRRTALLILFIMLILLVGPSRIYQGQHWSSDVFGAYMLGSVLLGLVIYLYRWGKPKFFVDQPTASPKKI
jgi:membrane-associated phospholipid phosphatase